VSDSSVNAFILSPEVGWACSTHNRVEKLVESKSKKKCERTRLFGRPRRRWKYYFIKMDIKEAGCEANRIHLTQDTAQWRLL
jgi:capsule polysaccharide export protein KpsC/LpsZ